MAGPVEKLFLGATMLCDGAMGTMLSAQGLAPGGCYEELNRNGAESVRWVHERYLLAGADVIETNTFGANGFRLERFGLRDEVRAINLAGAAVARQAVDAVGEKKGCTAWVAGSIGPLGVRLEPQGQKSLSAARAAFAEQIAALADGGVDLLMAETMMSVEEAEQVVLAAREVAPELKIAVLMTVAEDGTCLDGVSVESAAARLTAIGADAIGCNCSFGLASVLGAIKRMRAVTTLPLIAMPSAGLPQTVEDRCVYPSSPEHLASFARKLVDAGANWVGGCCGTTPEHIRAMRRSLNTMQASELREAVNMLEVA